MKTKHMLVALLIIMTTALFAGVASAQDDDGPGPRDRDHGPRDRHPAAQVMNTVAEELNLEPREIAQQMRDGATLAEVIEANGSSVEDITALIVADAEARLADAVAEGRITQEQADERLAQMTERLPELLENGFDRINPPDRGDRGDRETPRLDRAREIVENIAGELGLEGQEIVEQLRDGATLAEVIEANGGSVENITAFLLENVETRLSEQVEAGELTQEQADERLERAQSMIENLLNGELPQRRNAA